MITLQIGIEANQVMGMGYDLMRVYSDPDPQGAFTHLVTTITLVANQNLYPFNDSTATEPTWYRTTFFDSQNNVESEPSSAVEGIPSPGPMQFLSLEFVRGTTDFPTIANLPDEKLAELIFRAELILSNYGLRHGGFNTGFPHFGIIMALMARFLLEEIWLRTQPAIRISQANGLTFERIGSYEYRKAAATVTRTTAVSPIDEFFSLEMMDTLRAMVNVSPTKTIMYTTHVWQTMRNQLDKHGFNVKHWWDGVDEELFWQQWGNLVRIPGPWGDNYYRVNG